MFLGDFTPEEDDSYNRKCIPLLFLLSDELEARLNEAFSTYGISYLQAGILQALSGSEEGRSTINRIAASLPAKVNASRSISQLEKLGYALKKRSSSDQRTVYVTITGKGRQVLKEASQAMEKLLTLNLPEEKAEELYGLFSLMMERLAEST